MIWYANKKVLERKVFKTYKLWLVNGAVFAIVMLIFFVDSFCGLSFVQLVLRGILHTLWIVPLYIVANFIFCREAFKNLSEHRRADK